MDNHGQTKLEIAAAAEEVASQFGAHGTDICDRVSDAFLEFAQRIRESIGEGYSP